MIHAGKIILHEDTDVLLSDYAVLKVAEEEYEKLDQQYLIKIRKEAYGYKLQRKVYPYRSEKKRG